MKKAANHPAIDEFVAGPQHLSCFSTDGTAWLFTLSPRPRYHSQARSLLAGWRRGNRAVENEIASPFHKRARHSSEPECDRKSRQQPGSLFVKREFALAA